MIQSLVRLLALCVAATSSLISSSICVEILNVADYTIPLSEVRIVNLNSGEVVSVSADAKGRGCTRALAEGAYSVEASSGGYVSVRYQPVEVIFPGEVTLSFRLPIGVIREAGIAKDSTVHGTLIGEGRPLESVRICLYAPGNRQATACSTTNELGQYALAVPPGKYVARIHRMQVELRTLPLDLPAPGSYHNRLSLSK